jgi:hypothetical protein
MVDETETTFGPEHHRMDEYVFSARRILSEGEKPKLELVIENPRVGLLSSLRKQWCWFAWDNGTEIVPLFFGRVVGMPNDVQADTISVTFISWSSDYVKQLQKVAEAMKIPPHYDPVFTDVSKRDDPMAIFESHSKLVCVDPVTLVVTASDILDAEDGNVDFTEDDHFYDSVHVSPGAVPKTSVYVDASVSWTQTARGYVDMGNRVFNSYTGDGIISEWPRPMSQIAEGLSVFTSSAYDVLNTANIITSTISGSFQNKEKHHNDGDTLSFTWSYTVPQIHGSFISGVLTENNQTGFLDPFAVDGDGDPSPTNIPASNSSTTAYVPKWSVSTSLVLEYRAARQHTERLVFRLFADVQPTTLDPQVSDDSESLTISGADVGIPIIDLLNWTTVSETHVDVGTVIFPNDPQLPGGRTAQVCVVAGTTGAVEPDFSDVIGETTVDGTATWSSLGTATPTESAADWSGVSNTPTGTMILPRRPLFTTWYYFTAASRAQFPPAGTSVSEGTIIQASNGSFQVCTVAGTTGKVEPAFSTTWNDTTTDETVTWKSLGMTLPSGNAFFIATTGGTTGPAHVIPPFGTTVVNDGTVVWTPFGVGEIPVGGTPGNVTASTFFCQDRGRISIEYLICRARVLLRYASRCVTTQFQCTYARGIELTLRKSATLHDYRLPGGLVLGKITGTELIASGGEFTCNVTIQSSVGYGAAVEEVEGDPLYVADGYVNVNYQLHDGVVIILQTVSDVGYTPLLPVPDEDGIRFPLEKSMFVVSEEFMDNDQTSAIYSGLSSMRSAANPNSLGFGGSLEEDAAKQMALAVLQSNSVSEQLKRTPNWYDLVLKPLNGNGSFNHVYHLKCTTLSIPAMIDLQEEATS